MPQMHSPSVTLLLNGDGAEAPETIPRGAHQTQVTVGPMAKVYYSERIQSQVSTGGGYTGQNPEETRLKLQGSSLSGDVEVAPRSTAVRCEHM